MASNQGVGGSSPSEGTNTVSLRAESTHAESDALWTNDTTRAADGENYAISYQPAIPLTHRGVHSAGHAETRGHSLHA